ncbi:hypothetical protein FJZ27_03890 [Candidatus Peribacteria bacterium]|nr:hypothetical protein [Candidatus Peribacteria bacterium]
MFIIYGIAGMLFGIALIKYREAVGDMLGSADWMNYIGGPYMLSIFLGVFFFFYSFAWMTGTLDFFLAPLLWIIPVGR